MHTGYRFVNLAICGVLVILIFVLSQAEVCSDGNGGIILWTWHLPEMCLFKRIVGRPCPGCGMTQAMVRVLDGDVTQAQATHPSALWFAIWLGAQILARAILTIFPFYSHRLWVMDLFLSLTTLTLALLVPTLARFAL